VVVVCVSAFSGCSPVIVREKPTVWEKGPAQPSPALGDALNAGYRYLEVKLPRPGFLSDKPRAEIEIVD